MANVSLTMMRIYHPFRNSNLSNHGTSVPQWFLQQSVYSCLRHREMQVSCTVRINQGNTRMHCITEAHVSNPHMQMRKGARNKRRARYGKSPMCANIIQYCNENITCDKQILKCPYLLYSYTISFCFNSTPYGHWIKI